MIMRTAYRCRAYPDGEQQAVLNRTFGCARVVWNRTLARRRTRWRLEGNGTSYAETDRALTVLKKDPDLAFLNEVSSVPLQQALRHQHKAFSAFFAGRARYPRFKSRRSRQSVHYTRSAFRMKDGGLWLAKTAAPLRFVWSWPDTDAAALDPTMVIVSREPDGRWYLTFMIDGDCPEPLPQTGRAVGVDLGVKDFAVTSDGRRTPNPGTWNARPAIWPATSGAWPAARTVRRTGPRRRPRLPEPTVRYVTPGATTCTGPAPDSSARTT